MRKETWQYLRLGSSLQRCQVLQISTWNTEASKHIFVKQIKIDRHGDQLPVFKYNPSYYNG